MLYVVLNSLLKSLQFPVCLRSVSNQSDVHEAPGVGWERNTKREKEIMSMEESGWKIHVVERNGQTDRQTDRQTDTHTHTHTHTQMDGRTDGRHIGPWPPKRFAQRGRPEPETCGDIQLPLNSDN